MNFFSIGLPSVFAEWCDGVILQAAGRLFAGANFAAVNGLEDLALAVLRMEATCLVVGSRQPDGKLCKALEDGGLRFVLTLPSPRAAVADMMANHGYDLPSAVRGVASSAASIRRLAGFPGALVLREFDEGSDPVKTARAVCDHLDIFVSDDDLERIVRDLTAAGMRPGRQDIDAWWTSLFEAEQKLIGGALDFYGSDINAAQPEPITWERGLFFVGDSPKEPAMQAIDITGRVRCLIYGPYITIPAGTWTASIVFACSKETSGMSFAVEILSGQDNLARGRIQPDAGGVFELTLGFIVDKASSAPLEIRIFNERAAFDGRLGLGRVTLSQRLAFNAEDGGKITAALGLASGA